MTFFETALQPTAFLLLAAAGFLIGIAFDLGAAAEKRLPPRLQPVLDVLWCLAAAAACALALAVTGETQLRLYALLGLCCGAGMYCLGVRAAALAAIRFFRRGRGARAPTHDLNTTGRIRKMKRKNAVVIMMLLLVLAAALFFALSRRQEAAPGPQAEEQAMPTESPAADPPDAPTPSGEPAAQSAGKHD